MDGPKVIIGRKESLFAGWLPVYILPVFNYDWNPAQEPYDIPVTCFKQGCAGNMISDYANPRDKSTNNLLLFRILERFPLLWRVVSRLNVR